MSVGNLEEKKALILEEKRALIFGRKGVGKITFVDGLAITQSDQGIDFILPSDIKKISEDIFKTYTISSYHLGKIVNLTIDELVIPDLSVEETKIDFFDTLSENEFNYDIIFYMIDGSNNRLNNYIHLFIRKLIVYFGESILSNFVILQSKSNMIRKTLNLNIPELNEISNSEMKEFANEFKDMDESEIDLQLDDRDNKIKLVREKIKEKINEIYNFYNERCTVRKNQIMEEITNIVKYVRSYLDDENEEKKQSINKYTKYITYLEVGLINLNMNRYYVTNLPDYRFYNSLNYLCKKFFVSYEGDTKCNWVLKLKQKISNITRQPINFNQLRTMRKEIKKIEKESERDLRLLKLAIENAEQKIKQKIRRQDIVKFTKYCKSWIPYMAHATSVTNNNKSSYLEYLKNPENSFNMIDNALSNIIQTYSSEKEDELEIFLSLIIQEHARLKIYEGIK